MSAVTTLGLDFSPHEDEDEDEEKDRGKDEDEDVFSSPEESDDGRLALSKPLDKEESDSVATKTWRSP